MEVAVFNNDTPEAVRELERSKEKGYPISNIELRKVMVDGAKTRGSLLFCAEIGGQLLGQDWARSCEGYVDE